MRTTIERLRVAVIVGVSLVVVVVAGFLGYAHLRAHRRLGDLPSRLGADIEKETNGFTYSQSVKGRTVFTIHAVKATQHKDGRMGLEDVGLVLYRKKDGRADRIRGRRFEYDQKNGIVRANGEVQLDLQAPAPATASERAAYAAGGAAPGRRAVGAGPAAGQAIHVTTSGLVYVQGLGVASTDQPVQFEYRGMKGQARGAAYNSETGLMTLESEVRLLGTHDGKPALLTAAHVELDETNHRLQLRGARFRSGEGQEGVAAAEMVAHLGEEGQIESADASGGVELLSRTGSVRAPSGVLRMSAEGRPETAHLTGGVQFASEGGDGAGEALVGRAEEGTARFDGSGGIDTVRLVGGVRARSGEGGAMKEMSGRGMDLRFGGAAGSRRWVKEATVRGGARLETAAAKGHTAGSEEASADTLVARWGMSAGAPVLQAVTGEGQTRVRRVGDGVEEVSRGDRLDASFAAAAASAKGGARGELSRALQQGHVVLDRTTTAANGTHETVHGTAEQASYEAGGPMTLEGGAQLTEADGFLRAARIVLTGGDAEATGAVEATYRPGKVAGEDAGPSSKRGGAEAIHMTGTRAVMRRATGTATMFGASGGMGGGATLARLWQGGSQVEAPVLVFGRKEKTLDAYGTGEAMPVRTVLANVPRVSAGAGGGVAESPRRRGRPEVLRVRSGRLHFADATKRAEFTGGVLLEDANGTIESQEAVATLRGAEGATAAKAGSVMGSLFGSGVEQVVAKTRVVLRQPGRVATGEQALYTAAEGVFTLTGGAGAPPRVEDEVRGSVTGASLRFRSGDNSVTVDGRTQDGLPASGDGRVHLRTRVKR